MDNYKFRFKGTSGYWVVKNKDAVCAKLNYLNNLHYAKSIYSFDFKKLYTNLPHNKVIEKISDLINRCFQDKQVKFVNVDSRFKASWSDKKKGKWSLTKEDIIDMFTFLINNIYVKFRGQIYRQVIGIPMGCDCAPKVADLFLYWYENNYICRSVDEPELLSVIHILKYSSRYIDDLNVPNANDKICDIICRDIYPSELTIECTNLVFNRSSFLDLDIFVTEGGFSTKLYDKRRDFPFHVVTFANLKSNIPNSQAYGTFVGEVHRICKSSTQFIDFSSEIKLFVKKLVNQKFNVNELYSKLSRFINCKPACLLKYWKNIRIVDLID